MRIALLANAAAILALALTLELARRWIDGQHREWYQAEPWRGGR